MQRALKCRIDCNFLKFVAQEASLLFVAASHECKVVALTVTKMFLMSCFQ